jgi:hypothetical protein
VLLLIELCRYKKFSIKITYFLQFRKLLCYLLWLLPVFLSFLFIIFALNWISQIKQCRIMKCLIKCFSIDGMSQQAFITSTYRFILLSSTLFFHLLKIKILVEKQLVTLHRFVFKTHHTSSTIIYHKIANTRPLVTGVLIFFNFSQLLF